MARTPKRDKKNCDSNSDDADTTPLLLLNRTSGIHNSLRGNEYQLCVTMFMLLRAYNEYEQEFKLRMERTEPEVGDFDDVWLQVGREQLFVQVKHGSEAGGRVATGEKSEDPFLLKKMSESFERCRKLKSPPEGDRWWHVLVTNKPMQNSFRRSNFVLHVNDETLTHKILNSNFLKLWEANKSDKLKASSKFYEDFILVAPYFQLPDLRKKIKAEIRKFMPVDYELAFHCLRDKLFKWVCEKENRNSGFVDRKWVQNFIQTFKEKQKKKWKQYEEHCLSTIKESFQIFSEGRIEQNALDLYNQLKDILMEGKLQKSQTDGENSDSQTTSDSKQLNSSSNKCMVLPTSRKVSLPSANNVKFSDSPEATLEAINQIFALRQTLQISREFWGFDTHHLLVKFKIEKDTSTKVKQVLKEARLNTQGTIFTKSSLVLHCENEMVIIGTTLKSVEKQYKKLKAATDKVGLAIDASKTRYMSADGNRKLKEGTVNLDGDQIVPEKKVEFLGSIVEWDNGCGVEIETRVQIGKACCDELDEILKSTKLDCLEKWSIYESQIRAKVLCGSETWTIIAKNEKILKEFEEEISKIIFIDKKKPKTCKGIMATINNKREKLIEQLETLPNNNPAKKVQQVLAQLDEQETKKRFGTPKKRWSS